MNVPNRLTILRVAMIPLFVIAMLWQQLPYSDYIAGGLFIAACITDFLTDIWRENTIRLQPLVNLWTHWRISY